MIEKIIVVAPTTAVPMSTGLAVALNVLPAPSFSSRLCFARSKSTSKPYVFFSSALMSGNLLDRRELVDRLRVVGHRTVGVDRDRHRTHAEEAERDEAEREDGRRDHRRIARREAHRGSRSRRRAISDHDRHAEPVRAEVAGDEARQDVERRAALLATSVTTSRTCADSVDVKTLTSSGMIAPASVPHVMIVESFHQSVVPSPEVRNQQVRRARRSAPPRRSTSARRGASAGARSSSCRRRRTAPSPSTSLIRYDAARRDDHHDAHHEDPDEQLNLDGRAR